MRNDTIKKKISSFSSLFRSCIPLRELDARDAARYSDASKCCLNPNPGGAGGGRYMSLARDKNGLSNLPKYFLTFDILIFYFAKIIFVHDLA